MKKSTAASLKFSTSVYSQKTEVKKPAVPEEVVREHEEKNKVKDVVGFLNLSS